MAEALQMHDFENLACFFTYAERGKFDTMIYQIQALIPDSSEAGSEFVWNNVGSVADMLWCCRYISKDISNNNLMSKNWEVAGF